MQLVAALEALANHAPAPDWCETATNPNVDAKTCGPTWIGKGLLLPLNVKTPPDVIKQAVKPQNETGNSSLPTPSRRHNFINLIPTPTVRLTTADTSHWRTTGDRRRHDHMAKHGNLSTVR